MLAQIADNSTIQIQNSALASWLWTSGFNPVKFVPMPPPQKGYVVFDDSPALQKCRNLWETRHAIGDCNAFYDHYRTILERLMPPR